jgi:hypothetical protein
MQNLTFITLDYGKLNQDMNRLLFKIKIKIKSTIKRKIRLHSYCLKLHSIIFKFKIASKL